MFLSSTKSEVEENEKEVDSEEAGLHVQACT
jgi:hypothetical protein